MTDWNAVTDDELIAEVRRRLDAGRFGFHGLLSTVQSDHRDNWHALAQAVYDARNAFPDERGTRAVHEKLLELADRSAPEVGVHRVNTTFYGRDIAGVNQPDAGARASCG